MFGNPVSTNWQEGSEGFYLRHLQGPALPKGVGHMPEDLKVSLRVLSHLSGGLRCWGLVYTCSVWKTV